MPRGKVVYVKAKRSPSGPQKGIHWDDKKKMEAVTTYLSVGTLEMTSALTSVPVETLRTWKRSDWWKNHILELQEEENTAIGKRLSKILDKTLKEVEDRIEHGEFMYDPRTGKTLRIPAKLRDVHKVSTDLIDKKEQLVKLQRPTEEKQQVTTEHLVELAKAFAEMATGKKQGDKPPTVHEGNFKEVYEELNYIVPEEFNAIPEERETGLQSGATVGKEKETHES